MSNYVDKFATLMLTRESTETVTQRGQHAVNANVSTSKATISAILECLVITDG